MVKDKSDIIEDLLGSKARVSILRILALNSELSLTQIIQKTKLNYNSVLKHLHYLKSINFIQEKKFGRIKIYRYKIEDKRASSFRDFLNVWEAD
ncbi:MAG: hypothetical protein ACFFCI_22405 [Promethearchaeota archaeon]